jgi:hypothetical protein
MVITFFVAYFLILMLAIRFKTREVNGRWWFFLRAFFPNWKFFHAVGYAPRLYGRVLGLDSIWGPWSVMYPRHQRRWWHIIHNPRVNLDLAAQNLVDHLAADLNALAEGQDARSLVTYQMVLNRVRLDLAKTTSEPMRAFEFELRMELPSRVHGEPVRDSQVMMASGVQTL